MGAETVPKLCIGTAGHVDHGKTWLVRALTGKDTDRLPEEQERGISIDLGYAPLDLEDGRRLSLIDVPGHERFVRNMVAGATGIDLFLLVIDAAEGAKPQTHEHLAVLRLLGIEHGVVAVTKSDVVDPETLARTLEEARKLVPGMDVVAVSAKTGAGLAEVRRAIAQKASAHEQHRRSLPTRLFVDRVFTLSGIGTVATGTLWSGSIGAGDELRAEPRGLDVRVRSVQVHDEPVERAGPGQRVALALPGVERSDLARGDALAEPGAYPTSYRLDVVLDELEPIADGARLTVHHGTSQHPGRVVRAGVYAQIRLEAPVVAARGDRFVLRGETTVGGGRVLDPDPPRGVEEHRLRLLDQDDPAAIVAALVNEPITIEELRRRTFLGPDELQAGVATTERAGEWVFSREWLEETKKRVRAQLESAPPIDPGVPVAELLQPPELAAHLLPRLGLERRGAKAYLPGAGASLGDKAPAAATLEMELAAAGPNGARVDDAELTRFLETKGRLVRLGDAHAVSAAAYAEARETLLEECEREGRITLARFRDLLGISRKPAQLLLERLDADGVTRRVGDERILRRSALRH